jgi:hypothetical protein
MHGAMIITCNNGGYFMIKCSELLIIIGYLGKNVHFQTVGFFHSSVDRRNYRFEFIVANLDRPLSYWLSNINY